MKKLWYVAAAAVALSAAPASAGVILTVQDGTNPYSGPTPTYDFDSPATTPPTTNGLVKTGSGSDGAQPYGSTGNYYTVGPSTNSPGEIDLGAFGGAIGKISFIWGSVDDYNTLDILDTLGNVLYTFTGTDIVAPADGNQTNPHTNPLVTLQFTGGDEFNVGGLRLTSTNEAFEVDNIAIQAVPEPMTWLLMLVGFGFVGGLMRSTQRQKRRVSFAM